MQTMRRVLLLGALLVVPVLLAVAGTLLAAPPGPPAVDANPIELGPGPDGRPAPGLEPTPSPTTPAPVPTTPAPAPTTPVAPAPAPPVVPQPVVPEPVVPVPVVPPVVIDDDDDAGEVDD